MLTVTHAGRTMTRPARFNREQRELFALANDVSRTFLAALEGVSLTIESTSSAGVPATWTSAVTSVAFEDPLRLTVALRPGLVIGDLEENSARIAEALRCPRVDFERIRPGFVRVTVHYSTPEPFAEPLPAPGPVPTVHEAILLGRHESGREIWRSLVDLQHLIVQGATQSGKSTFAYSLLSQLSDAPDVIVAGSDVSGLLLRPWAKRTDQHAGWQALGTQSVAAHVSILDRLVKRMDARLRELPEGTDHVEITPDCPLILCILEELPGLLRQASKQDREQITAAYGRLLAEGAKAGIRVLLITQRADAELVGGYARGQCTTRLSFQVDNEDAVKMLHPNAPKELALAHTIANPGTALLTLRGAPLTRMQGPMITSSEYWHRVA